MSLVAPRHPVYEWLHRQRVLGHAEDFALEALPVSRADLASLLRSVEAKADDLGGVDRELLRWFLQEFAPAPGDEDSAVAILSGGAGIASRVAGIIGEGREPHLLAGAAGGATYVVDGLGALGAFSGDGDAESGRAALPELGVRGYVDFSGWVGGHLEVGRMLSSGAVRAVQHDSRYNRTEEVVDRGRGSSTYVEAALSVRYGAVRADAGRGTMRFGAGFGEPLMLSPASSQPAWVRVAVNTPRFKYTAVHSWLDSPVDAGIITLPDGTTTSAHAIDRRMAAHRVEMRPLRTVTLGFSEALIYSARPLDLAYLNPVNLLFFSELDNEDRDNAFWIFDVTWRPIRRIELYVTALADDLVGLGDLVRRGAPKEGVDRAFDVGGSAALPGGFDASLRYVRIEPFVYTHWQRLNGFEQGGFPLGHSLGPNADQTLLRLRRWLPRRGWVALSLADTRKGMNPVGPDGRVLENRGGEVTLGSVIDFNLDLFEGADLQEYREVGLEGAFEPWRGVQLSARYFRRSVSRGARVTGMSFFRLGLRLGF